MSPVPDAAKIRRVSGKEFGGRDQPARSHPVLSRRCTPFLAPRTRSLGHRRAQGRVGKQTESGLSLRLARNSRLLLSLPAPATWVPLRDLGRPRLPIRPPTGLSFQHPQPPSGVQGPRVTPRPRAGSEAKLGRGPGRPGCRALEKEGAPSPLGAVSMLCTWGRRAAGVPSPGP